MRRMSMPSWRVWIIAVGSVLSLGGFAQTRTTADISTLRVIIPYYGTDESAMVQEYLRAGDLVVLHPPRPEMQASGLSDDPAYWIKVADQFKARHSEIETIFNFDGLDKLRLWTPKLPKSVDWVSYDYERWKTTPEFDVDQGRTIERFEQARAIARKNGKRLFLTPVPFFNPDIIDRAVKAKYLPEPMKPWDLGSLARLGGAFNAQFQGSLRESEWLRRNLAAMNAELDREAPDTVFTVQLGGGPPPKPYTEAELKQALEIIANTHTDGVVIWFFPRDRAWGERVLRLMRGRP